METDVVVKFVHKLKYIIKHWLRGWFAIFYFIFRQFLLVRYRQFVSSIFICTLFVAIAGLNLNADL